MQTQTEYLSEPYYSRLKDPDKTNFRINAGALIYDIGANCNAKYTTDDTIVHNDGEQTAVKKALRHFGYLYGNVNRYKWELIEDSLKQYLLGEKNLAHQLVMLGL